MFFNVFLYPTKIAQKKGFAEVFKNLFRSRFESNFVRTKIIESK